MISKDVRDLLALVPGLEIAEDDFGDNDVIMNMALPNCQCPRCTERRLTEE